MDPNGHHVLHVLDHIMNDNQESCTTFIYIHICYWSLLIIYLYHSISISHLSIQSSWSMINHQHVNFGPIWSPNPKPTSFFGGPHNDGFVDIALFGNPTSDGVKTNKVPAAGEDMDGLKKKGTKPTHFWCIESAFWLFLLLRSHFRMFNY